MTIPSLAFAETLESDIEPLTRIMTRAFDDDTRVHLGQERGGPPGYDNGDFFRKWLFERFIEAAYPQTVSWSLDTPVWSVRNRHFYEHKCGFREDRIKDGFVFFRKAMPEPAGAA